MRLFRTDWNVVNERLGDATREALKPYSDKVPLLCFIWKILDSEKNEGISTFCELSPLYKDWLDQYFPYYFEMDSMFYWYEPKETNTYSIYRLTPDGVYGGKEFEGIFQWKLLKFFKFMMNRLNNDERVVNQAIEEFHRIKLAQSELTVKFQDLVEGYNETSIESCMRGKGGYFRVLNKYGKLATFSYKDLIARAIIWDKEYVEGFPKEWGEAGFMDRIYSRNNHEMTHLIKQWAWGNNLVTKLEQSYENKEDFEFKNEKISSTIILKIDDELDEGDYMPYMDTFSYYNQGDTVISNVDGDIKFDSTEGRGVEEQIRCACCGDVCRPDESYSSIDGDICEHCRDNHYVYAEDAQDCVLMDDTYYCETDGYYYRSDRDLIRIGDRYYLSDDDNVFYCDHCCEYYHSRQTDMYYSEYHGYTICEDCIDEYSRTEDTEDYIDNQKVYLCEEDNTAWEIEENYIAHLEEIGEKEDATA